MKLSIKVLCVLFSFSSYANAQQSKPILTKIWETDTSLIANESAIYDKYTNAIYTSCMGNSADTTDGDGFIAKINLQGKVEKLHWAKGLNCPKGMAIYKKQLYTIDIDELVVMDLKTGKISRKVKLSDKDVFNDIDIDQKTGGVYLSQIHTGEVMLYKNEKLETIHKLEKSEGSPNGVHYVNNALYFVTTKGKVYKKVDGQAPMLIGENCFNPDGLETYKNGGFCSSWKGKVYYFSEGEKTTTLLDYGDKDQYIGDIDVVEEKQLLICPTLFLNKVVVYKID